MSLSLYNVDIVFGVRVKNTRSLHRTFNVEPLYLQHENTGLAIDYMVSKNIFSFAQKYLLFSALASAAEQKVPRPQAVVRAPQLRHLRPPEHDTGERETGGQVRGNGEVYDYDNDNDKYNDNDDDNDGEVYDDDDSDDDAQVRSDARFEIPAARHLGMVVFRLKGDCAMTEKLLKKLNSSGKLHAVPC